MPSADEKCPADRRATVTGRWFGGCAMGRAGSEVCCAPNDEPATVLYAPRVAWFVKRTIRAFAATHACPDPQPAVRCSARAPDADANHGSQVGSPLLHQIVSEALDPSLPAEFTLRRLFTGSDWSSLW